MTELKIDLTTVKPVLRDLSRQVRS